MLCFPRRISKGVRLEVEQPELKPLPTRMPMWQGVTLFVVLLCPERSLFRMTSCLWQHIQFLPAAQGLCCQYLPSDLVQAAMIFLGSGLAFVESTGTRESSLKARGESKDSGPVRWLSWLILPFHPPESTGISFEHWSCPGYSTLHPVPCLWPGKPVDYSLKS